MTKVVNGYAQPDIEATKGTKKLLVFVETPDTFHAPSLRRTIQWLRENEPDTTTRVVMTKPRRQR